LARIAQRASLSRRPWSGLQRRCGRPLMLIQAAISSFPALPLARHQRRAVRSFPRSVDTPNRWNEVSRKCHERHDSRARPSRRRRQDNILKLFKSGSGVRACKPQSAASILPKTLRMASVLACPSTTALPGWPRMPQDRWPSSAS